MDKQAIFDQVKHHLLAQNALALDDDDCVYRAPDGRRCAIGALIPDDLYHEEMEGEGFNNECFTSVRNYLGVNGPNDMTFLDNLRRIHDDVEVRDWEYALTAFAARYGLKYAE